MRHRQACSFQGNGLPRKTPLHPERYYPHARIRVFHHSGPEIPGSAREEKPRSFFLCLCNRNKKQEHSSNSSSRRDNGPLWALGSWTYTQPGVSAFATISDAIGCMIRNSPVPFQRGMRCSRDGQWMQCQTKEAGENF